MADTRQSVSYWITQLKGGDLEAVQQLWNRYSLRLVSAAQVRLKNAPKQVADEEDIAASVFQSLCRGAAEGRFINVTDRDELWWLLLTITRQKAVNHIRRETALKRGCGVTHSESDLHGPGSTPGGFSMDQLISDEPTPEFILMLEEQSSHLFNLLRNDQLREIALLRVEGYGMQEIADLTGTALRTIERKVKLIRDRWKLEVES